MGGVVGISIFGKKHELSGRDAIEAVVDRIIAAESDGRLNAANKASSAAGPGQFIEETGSTWSAYIGLS
jgi:hypothetical protein